MGNPTLALLNPAGAGGAAQSNTVLSIGTDPLPGGSTIAVSGAGSGTSGSTVTISGGSLTVSGASTGTIIANGTLTLSGVTDNTFTTFHSGAIQNILIPESSGSVNLNVYL